MSSSGRDAETAVLASRLIMKITSAEFLKGVTDLRGLPASDRKEVAFLGRSNVGKSTLISDLCGKKELARTGKTPGKTRELNYFVINDRFYFVDLPGYGFARLPAQMRSGLGRLIEGYLEDRSNLACAIQLIDARHPPTKLDMMMVGWLDYYDRPFIIVLTKADKLPRRKIVQLQSDAGKKFTPYSHCLGVIHFSSVTGEGKSALLDLLAPLVS